MAYINNEDKKAYMRKYSVKWGKEYRKKCKLNKFGWRYENEGLKIKWYAIKTRCSKKYFKHHIYYDKGIRVEWKSYEDFKKDMLGSFLLHLKEHGRKNTTIDRIDGNKNYSKENCRWATILQQNQNRYSLKNLKSGL